MPDPTDAFATWLLHRVAQAVEARQVPADLLAELRTKMEGAKDLPQEEGHALAVQDIAERVGLSEDRVEKMLEALEAQPAVTQELVLRRFVEAWLAQQRERYRAEEHGD